MKHECHWPACNAEVPPAMWGCRKHWYQLPKHLRDRIWATYRAGQKITKTPSAAYLEAALDVQRWIRDSATSTGAASQEPLRSPMLALTLIQPWAHAVAHLGKPVENRSWRPPAAALSQRICIHAGAKCDEDSIDLLALQGHIVPDKPVASAIVATTVLAGWVRDTRSYSETLTQREAEQALASEWYVEGSVGWVLRDTQPLSKPVPCKGAQGLWRVPPTALAELYGHASPANEPAQKRLVVHCKRDAFDVLIARPSVWGNPFSHLPRSAAEHRAGSREEAIERYEAWLLAQPALVARARAELRGKVLACYCAPLPCHGDVLARIANQEQVP